ncbi:TraB/GumN family protein [Caulobacter sp. 73W]|uniref:TraB/GumN family protein n=1 Tax=Caulobacter sp. 73W TaxID=3161137 RepID=A0AB39KMW4_9CAUL
MIRSLVSLSALLLAACLPVGASAEPPVWVVRDADSEIVIFGSMHILPAGVDWRPDALDAALAKADDLWFELPMDAASQAEVGRAAQAKGYLSAGQTLTDLMGPKDGARLRKVADELGLPMAVLQYLRPWLAEVSLANAMFMKSSASRQEGVEAVVERIAPASATRRAFETPEQQISILADTPQADQIASLRQTLEELEQGPGAYDDLVRAWAAGDIRALEEEALEPIRKTSPVLYRRLIIERNVRWVEAIKARMAGSGETVIVVGAGHLVGKDGLPARLRALGFKVEGP